MFLLNHIKNPRQIKVIIIIPIFITSLFSQEFKMIIQHVSLTQSPMASDSLVLKGAIGRRYSSSSSGEGLNLKSGLWNAVSEIYALPPTIQSSFPDTIKKDDKQVYARAVVNDMNGIEKVELHVQIGGDDDIIVLEMDAINDSTYQVTIQDSLRSILNLRGQIVSTDRMFNIARTTQNTPYLSFGINELTMNDSLYSYYQDGLPSSKWRLFSFPGDLYNSKIEHSDLEEGHVFYDWDPVGLQWIKPDSIEIGRGYWFKHQYPQSVVFSNKDTIGYAVPLEEYTIHLNKGANMIGSPFSFPVQAEYSEGVSFPYRYGEGDKDGWADTTVFEPWAGYAVYSPSDTGTITFVPFSDSTSVASRSIQNGWRMEIDVIGTHYFDRTAAIGRIDDANEMDDPYDVPLLPSLGNSLHLLMDIGSNGTYAHSSDMRSNDEFNGVWNMQVQGNDEPGPIRLTASSMRGIPTDLRFAIIDVPNREVIINFPQQELTIEDKIDDAYDVILIAGEESYVLQTIDDILADIPEEYSLGQNYPNPFNPITKIDFALPRTGDVSLVIYNLMGQQVKTLFAKNMEYGFHTITWNGLDQFGRPVSSGVYFSELRAPGFRQTKKMLMLK